MKRFNVTGLCIPAKHYMVDTSEKIKQIKALVDEGFYFTINRARQYGKTTTLYLLRQQLKDEYIAVSISFEGVGIEPFDTVQDFCAMFTGQVRDALKFSTANESYAESWYDETVTSFDLLKKHITKLCKDTKLVLLIDEVDKTSNNQVFLGFLGMLRDKYLAEQQGMDFTFHSVVLAGVNDIKTIKLKLINQGLYTPKQGEGIHNSPWNIAINFTVDMSFNPVEIETMLQQYENDHHSGMDKAAIAQRIYDYTGGYPFLVSRMCQAIDAELNAQWTADGIQAAVKIILQEDNTLFASLIKTLNNDAELFDFLYSIVIVGVSYNYNLDNPLVSYSVMYGILKNVQDKVAISNRIFELRLSNYFISINATTRKETFGVLQYDIVQNGKFNMELCLKKFAQHYQEIYNELDTKFLEREGRLIFLTYLKPLINGQGFYHIESQFTDLRRMDLVVDFNKEQFILELKLWHGDAKHEEAYSQLAKYLSDKHANEGYLLTFDFRKNKSRKHTPAWVAFEGKKIFDCIV
ncbi:hypothetical protein FACS1894200_04890 [Spirochaetia bacterium]|nr:hypothetical protein FACS1894200_04890 [Spirochaetia bacterium]